MRGVMGYRPIWAMYYLYLLTYLLLPFPVGYPSYYHKRLTTAGRKHVLTYSTNQLTQAGVI